MAHAVESMAWANEVPWHGLGQRVDSNVSIEEMLVAAGLDWKVQLWPTFAHVNGAQIRVPNKSALVRDLDNKVLTSASDNWKPVQNREVLEFFREYARSGGATLETAGSLRGGKTVWGLANLGHGFTTNNGRDAVKGYVLLASHHEMGKATTVRVTGTRVVCANTMAIAMRGSKTGVYSQNHVNEFNPEAARDAIGIAHESMVRMEMNAKALESLQISEFDTVRLLAKYFTPAKQFVMLANDKGDLDDNVVRKLMSEPDLRSQAFHEVMISYTDAPGAVPGNGWGVLNAVTHWADHVAGRSKDARLNKAWFGENADLKLDVEKELLEMVG